LTSVPNTVSALGASTGAVPEAVATAPPAGALDLRTLFEQHYGSVWRLLRRFGVAPAELDDHTQEVFWVAARRLGDLQPGREKSFLYGVSIRVASNAARERKQLPSSIEEVAEPFDPRPTPEEHLDQRQTLELLDEVLGCLPLELRTVLVLFELEGLAVAEIAELEGVPLGTASSRLRRARQEFSEISKRVRSALTTRGGLR